MLNAKVKAYVAEMGIGDGFYQKMMDTDSSKMAILDRKDIPGVDPEIRSEVSIRSEISREARRNGISGSGNAAARARGGSLPRNGGQGADRELRRRQTLGPERGRVSAAG